MSEATINENLKQIDKLNENLELSEVQKAQLEKEKDDLVNTMDAKVK